MAAPIVVIAGYDDVAQRIKAIAAENKIAQVESIPLERALAKETAHVQVSSFVVVSERREASLVVAESAVRVGAQLQANHAVDSPAAAKWWRC